MKRILSNEEIVKIARGINDIRDKALFSILYLTGARVGEIVERLRKNQFYYSFGKRNDEIPILQAQKEVVYPYLIIKDIWTEKRQKTYLRNVPLNFEKDKELINNVLDYFPFVYDQIIFPIGRIWAWRIIKRHAGFNPHWLRHTRLTHWTTLYGYKEQELKQLTGWTTTRMADTYVSLDYNDLLRKL